MQSKASLKLLHYLTVPALKGVAVPSQVCPLGWLPSSLWGMSELLYRSSSDRNRRFCSAVLRAMVLNAGCLTTVLVRCGLCCA